MNEQRLRYTRASWFAALVCATVFGLPLTACKDDDGPLEEVGEELDEAVEDVEEAVEDATDDGG